MNERVYKALNERGALQRYFARRFLFGLAQRLGFHVTGDHFYEIVPNTDLIARTYRSEPRELPGIDFRYAECERRALDMLNRYGGEFSAVPGKYGFREKNHYFRGMDALMLYCMLRQLKPEKYVEVGQGFSTSVSFAALEQNAREGGRRPVFVSIDPYARLGDRPAPPDVEFQFIQKELQEVPMAGVLDGCNFLFIDSSHVYKFGSDVAFEIPVLYPQLRPGTILHVHDIFSPYDYPVDWMVKEKRFWNEQYVLEAFLMYNAAFEVFLPVHYLVQKSALLGEKTRSLSLDPNFKYRGSSFYLRRH